MFLNLFLFQDALKQLEEEEKLKEQEKLEKILQQERESSQQEESEKQTTEVSVSEDSLPSEESKTVVENTSITTSSQIKQETVLVQQEQPEPKMEEQQGIQRIESADRELEGATLATDDSDWNKIPESMRTAPVERTLEHQLTSQSTFQGILF